MSDKNDDINLKIWPVKKTKKSLLAKITSALSFGTIDVVAATVSPITPVAPITFPVAPITSVPIAAPPLAPFVSPTVPVSVTPISPATY